MIEFFSPRVALETAIEIQHKIRELNENSKDSAMEFRMGLNFGDVMVDRDNLFGAGVNVAARLEESVRREEFASLRKCRTRLTVRLILILLILDIKN